MKDIIIVGAGGFGRELLQWIKDINRSTVTWNVKGFIDDNLQALDDYECDYSVIGKIEDWIPSENEVFTCAIAAPKIKEEVVLKLKNKGALFASVVHPSAIIGEFNKIGEGFIMTPGAGITVNVQIGDFVTLLCSAIGHDAVIGDYSTISGNCSINGHVALGKSVFVGSNVSVAPSKKISDNAYIGTGSIVISNIKAGIKVAGNPARRIDF